MLPTNDIDKATRAAAQLRAHEMCIDKIAELDKKLKFAETWIEENEGGRDFKLYLDNAKDI